MRISVFQGRYHGSILLHIFIKGEIIKDLLIFMIFVEISYTGILIVQWIHYFVYFFCGGVRPTYYLWMADENI